jgi:hypothetical protein
VAITVPMLESVMDQMSTRLHRCIAIGVRWMSRLKALEKSQIFNPKSNCVLGEEIQLPSHFCETVDFCVLHFRR